MPSTDFTEEIAPDIKAQTPSAPQAFEELIQLMNMPGWIRLRNVIQIKITQYEDEILNSDIQGEELNRKRDRKDLCRWFVDLPHLLIDVLKEPESSGDQPNFDPYTVPGVPTPPPLMTPTVDNTTEIG